MYINTDELAIKCNFGTQKTSKNVTKSQLSQFVVFAFQASLKFYQGLHFQYFWL